MLSRGVRALGVGAMLMATVLVAGCAALEGKGPEVVPALDEAAVVAAQAEATPKSLQPTVVTFPEKLPGKKKATRQVVALWQEYWRTYVDYGNDPQGARGYPKLRELTTDVERELVVRAMDFMAEQGVRYRGPVEISDVKVKWHGEFVANIESCVDARDLAFQEVSTEGLVARTDKPLFREKITIRKIPDKGWRVTSSEHEVGC